MMWTELVRSKAILQETQFVISEKIQLLLKERDRIAKTIKQIDICKKKVITYLEDQRRKELNARGLRGRVDDIIEKMIFEKISREERIELLTLAVQSQYWNYAKKYKVKR